MYIRSVGEYRVGRLAYTDTHLHQPGRPFPLYVAPIHHHSVTAPDLSKPPHRPDTHPRLHIQVSGMDTQIPTQIRSAAEVPSSDKERDLPRDKGPTPNREFMERRQSRFLQSHGGNTSGDCVHAIITTRDQ